MVRQDCRSNTARTIMRLLFLIPTAAVSTVINYTYGKQGNRLEAVTQ